MTGAARNTCLFEMSLRETQAVIGLNFDHTVRGKLCYSPIARFL